MDIVYGKRKLVSDVRRPEAAVASSSPRREERRRVAVLPASVPGRIDGIRAETSRKNAAPSAKAGKLSLRARAWRMFRRSELAYRRMRRILIALIPRMTPHKAFYLSLVGGVAFGIFTTALTFRFLDSDVRARVSETTPEATGLVAAAAVGERNVEEESGDMTPYDPGADIFLEYFNEAAEEEYQAGVRELVKGYPIEAMLPYIFEKDRVIAAFLVGIGKKESNWGKRVPVLKGQDCFNYWGYRGVRRMMGTGGHTCFNSRKDAVDTVARRIEKLVYSEKLDTPEKMILWKCGFSCAGHSRESVKKWISDVDMYFRNLNYE